jgi:hypothetical protein
MCTQLNPSYITTLLHSTLLIVKPKQLIGAVAYIIYVLPLEISF